MIRTLVIGLLIFAAVLLIRRLWSIQKEERNRPKIHSSEKMMKCDHCAVHFPESEAVRNEHGAFCSAAHAEAAEHSNT